MITAPTFTGRHGPDARRCRAALATAPARIARIAWPVLVVATLATGCGTGGGDSGATAHAHDPACRLAPMREWVEASLLDYYLFADRVQPVRLEDFDSDAAVLRAMRVEPPDRYSYLADEVTYDALFEQGQTFGFGWVLERVSPSALVFSRVQPGSPLERAGVVRGDRLIAIDGLSIDDFSALTEAERERRLGLPATPTDLPLVVENGAGERLELVVRSATFPLVTVADVDVVEHRGARVGYLDFTSFLATSIAELDTAFERLAGIDELVLDLRHNGGGRVAVAADLAARIGGRAVDGEVFARFRYNERYAASDVELPFAPAPRPLDLARVFVLTSDRTCSASELVINALEPFVDVVTVGARTCGKPYGTAPERRCGRVLNALEVSFRNAADVGDYVDGLPADCAVDDDPRHPQGRPGDPLYDAALGVLESGSCDGAGPFADATGDARGRAPAPGDESWLVPPSPGGAILPRDGR